MSATAHDLAFAALPELALDALDGRERDDVLAHARECLVCRRELDALRDVTAGLAETIVPMPLSAVKGDSMRERLMARAAAERAPASRPASQAVQARIARGAMRGPWLAAAGLLLAVSLGTLAVTARSRAEALAQLEASNSRNAITARALADRNRQLEERSAMIAALTGPNVAVVNLVASGSRDPVARMFWNRTTNRWTMVAHDLPQPAAGRTYQLWLVTATEKISAGTFKPGVNGDALVQATYALPPDALRAIAVTEEPLAGVLQPTGPIVISGAAG